MKAIKMSKEVELIVGVIGAAQGLYISIHTFLDRHKNNNNVLLGLLFLALTVRVIKSLLWVYLDFVPSWFLNIGFMAHSLSGPCLLLYTYTFVFNKKWSPSGYLHFIPTAFLLLLTFSLTLDNFWYLGGYSFLLIQQMLYTIASIGLVLWGLKIRKTNTKLLVNPMDRIWILILVGSTFLLQMAYFSNYILSLTPYLLGPIVYAIFIYFLSFFGLRNPQIFNRKKRLGKYRNINLAEDNLKLYKHKLQTLMTNEKPYLESNCSIGLIADKINLPLYLVSHIINNEFYKNFSDFINVYRINDAQLLLKRSDYGHIKISSIAYECGFNSLSSFNKAFKKVLRMTPTEYRKMSNL